METNTNTTQEVALETIITNAVKLPLVKVDRDSFLAEAFASTSLPLSDVLEKGPVAAGASRKMLSTLSQKLIVKRTSQSAIASFAAGIPGGLAMAATVPADVLQFFGMSLRLAQELSYLYGARDLWQNGEVAEEQVQSQLILYCGVMFGVSGAMSGVRVLSTQIAKTTLKRLPQTNRKSHRRKSHQNHPCTGRFQSYSDCRRGHLRRFEFCFHAADGQPLTGNAGSC